jgi:hypothetical protein
VAAPSVISQLRAVAIAHLSPCPRAPRLEGRTQVEIRAVRGDLKRLIRRVDVLSPSTQKRLQSNHHQGSLLKILFAIRALASGAVNWIESMIRQGKNPVGGPLDRTTRDLALAVAIVLRRNGITLALSRGGASVQSGQFAQVLGELLFEQQREIASKGGRAAHSKDATDVGATSSARVSSSRARAISPVPVNAAKSRTATVLPRLLTLLG